MIPLPFVADVMDFALSLLPIFMIMSAIFTLLTTLKENL